MNFLRERNALLEKHPCRSIEAGGASFRYILAGSSAADTTLVLLNGGTNCMEMWMKYVELLGSRYQLLLFDYPLQLATNQELVKGMHSFFERLRIQKPVFVGASDGGLVAQLYTRQYPGQVGGLVLFSTGGMDASTLRSLRRRYFAAPLLLWYLKHCNYDKMRSKIIAAGTGFAKNENADTQAYVREMFEVIAAEYTREKDLHMTGLLVDLLRQVPVTARDFEVLKGKILLILPKKDFFSPKMQKNLIGLMHEPKVIMTDGCHISTVLQPEKYAAAIDEFLQTAKQ